MQFYREARRRLSETLARARKSGVRRVAFVGVSELAEIAYLGVQEQGLELVDVFDEERAGTEFLGVKVAPARGDGGKPGGEVLGYGIDRALPMGEYFLPSGLPAKPNGEGRSRNDPRLLWIFGAAPPRPGSGAPTGGKRKGRAPARKQG